jgi:hypothetical protein
MVAFWFLKIEAVRVIDLFSVSRRSKVIGEVGKCTFCTLECFMFGWPAHQQNVFQSL